MTLFYFNADNQTQFGILQESGIKNISVSYKFVKKNLKTLASKFDSIILNTGSGKRNFEAQEYHDFVKANKENYSLVLQYDQPAEIRRTVSYYSLALEQNIDWIVPILHEDYYVALNNNKPIIRTNVIALGQGKSKIEEDESLKKLPSGVYHGLAKARWLDNKDITSIDSSTWISGVRNGKIQLMFNDGVHEVFINELSQIRQSMEINKEFVNFKFEDIQAKDHRSILKLSLACHYKPLLRKFGVFEKNFR